MVEILVTKMMKLIKNLVVILFFSSCVSSTETINKDSESMVDKKKDSTEGEVIKMLMTYSGKSEPSIDIKLYECNFKIVLNDFGDTTHWSTNDNNFITPEGFRIGTNWDELPVELQNSINKTLGWGYYIKLDSDWQLGFCEGDSCTDTEPKEGSTVKWIFKKND